MEHSKIVLITGGSRGLGKNMALAVAGKGLNVVITYHSNKEKAAEVVKAIESAGQKGLALQLDVSNSHSFPAFYEALRDEMKSKFNTDKFDYLINNAGTGVFKNVAETTGEEIDSMYNIHYKGPFLLTHYGLKYMNDGGGIINISSGLTRFSIPGYGAYAAMKGALETLTTYMAKELGERQIRANVIAPGAVETDFGGGAVRDNKELNDFIASTTPLGRVGLPDDIGGVAAFLCTDDAKWINAQRIEVSGGMMI